MGLDITAYRKLTKVDAAFDQYGDPIDPITREPMDDGIQLYINPSFPGRADDIEDGAVYRAEASLHVAAGSYSYYNSWRRELAALSGYVASAPDADNSPFYELICFSDCEGTLGTAVCAKLAKDFADYHGKAKAHGDGRFRTKYAEWRAAFELAADGGALVFH